MRPRHPSRMHVPTTRRIIWATLVRLCTFFIPDFILHYVLNLNSQARRQDWREKITLVMIFLFCAGFFCFWLEFISTLFCDQNKYFNKESIFTNNSHMAALRDKAIDWHDSNSEMAKQVNRYVGYDVTPMFPTFMELQRNTSNGNDPPYTIKVYQRCIANFGMASKADHWLDFKLNNDKGYLYKNDQLVSCPLPNHTNVTGAPCHYSTQDVAQEQSLGFKGQIIYDVDDIHVNYSTLPTATTPGKGFVILDNAILDVTSYLESATNVVLVANGVHSRAFASDRMFLPLDLTTLLYLKLGRDITPYFDEGNVTSDPEIYRKCLHDLFQVGLTNDGKVEECLHINPALWATMGCGLFYFLVKMNLANLSRLPWVQRSLFQSNSQVLMNGGSGGGGVNASRAWPMTLLLVPCYAENAETIRDTLNSLARTNYEDSRKMLVFVCDGLTQSAQDAKNTYECVMESLGCSTSQTTLAHAYLSLGQHRRKLNFAKVYSGFYETGRNRVPFMVIVKVGAPGEISVGRAPGNRGKRDSLVLMLSFLERCMNLSTNRLTPLEYELFNQCYNVLGIDPRRFKYLMVTDADIQVQNDAVHKLVARLECDHKMLAISGHIRPANPEQNLITMLQIFPLYMTFFTGLAYEACLGNVLTINAGLVMYKLWTESVLPPPSSFPFGRRLATNQGNLTSQLRMRQRISKIQSTSQESIRSKWPKVSDEIEFDDDDNDDDPFATLQKDTATAYQPTRISSSDRPSITTGRESQISLSPNKNTRPYCIHPTVLRSFVAPQLDTLHMKNVLWLGEDQYFATVLLRSHPHHRLGFEPDAVGYSTIPTNYWALQALQSRNLRAAFHIQVEMTRVAKHIGFAAWFLSFTKILDMIFSMPIIVYLYGIFIRCFMLKGLAYYIIAISFGALFLLHIIYFLIRRQFKYVLWFFLYCILSVPLFAIWFPLVAAWCSDYAGSWYDVWPTAGGWRWRDRLHGCVDDDYSRRVEQQYYKKKGPLPPEVMENEIKCDDSDEENHDVLVRMRLGEYEEIEAQRAYERATEEAAELDAKFTGFTAFGQSHSLSNPTTTTTTTTAMDGINDVGAIPSLPPLAQIRDDYSGFYGATSGYRPTASTMDMFGTIRKKRVGDTTSETDQGNGPMEHGLLPRLRLVDARSTSSLAESLATNPFADSYDNPFDDGHAITNDSSSSSPSSMYAMGEVLTTHHPAPSSHRYYQPPKSSSSSSSSSSSPRHERQQYFKQHRSSHSQSSYFSPHRLHQNHDYYSNTPDMFIPMQDTVATISGDPKYKSGGAHARKDTQGHFRSYSAESAVRLPGDDQRSIASQPSISNSCLSFDPEPALESRNYTEDEEGRSIAIHGRVGLKIPERSAAAMTAAAYRQRHTPNINKGDMIIDGGRTRQQPRQQLKERPISQSPITQHQHTTSDSSQEHTATASTLVELIQIEIRAYLSHTDLDLTTRAEVKEHLATVLGERTRMDSLQDTINHCIEETTLELLSQQSPL